MSIVGTDIIYSGSMIIRTWLPASALKKDITKRWLNKERVEKGKKKRQGVPDTDDIEVLIYYGDLIVPRSTTGDMFVPNRKTIVANEIFVFSEVNELAYSPIIYTGFERDDPRDTRAVVG